MIKKITLSSLCTLILLFCLSQTVLAQRVPKRKIRKLIRQSEINRDHFTGFALYDPEKKKMVYELNADKYFIPASNTKLYTFYACLQMLGDSIPGLRYVVKGDSLIFWGTGDPAFLHSTLKSTKAFDLLKNAPQKLFYCASNYNGNFYGVGWPYDNYSDYYQAEITAMPLEDNVAVIKADKQGGLQIIPSYLKRYLQADSTYHPPKFTVHRDLASNQFKYPVRPVPPNFHEEIPWKTSAELTLALLEDTLKRSINLIDLKMPADAKLLYSAAADSVYKRMLLPSDNFIAEQLLLVCSSTLGGGMLSIEAAIAYCKKNLMNDLPDEPQWVDGSGLSRQNLFTPRTTIALLVKIQDKVANEQKLHSLLPTGGISGTLKNAYQTDKGIPFVWGKTGTLNNNHNQSGYLITRKGKRLLFCYMNNNYTRPTADIRNEMVRVMTEIHNRF
ncbi:peptidase S13 D-Ala-D-Ala carboxypeptidase C [Mucilaginibacter paludis DSM 18603]|uniref:Peptidase S13 D-Ala-D-Ala carboxypeptidase C n=2 Tax=Mucilaginibacter TaxID=423349 RepID=H1Y0V4_9SPHI|nr:peptidase S13 D-Ala-D-Ala carboxypeptidase C [Mucilaginibacter paludis DSM 18603]